MSFNIEDSFVEGLSHHRMIFEGSYIGATYATGCMKLFINEKVPYEMCVKQTGKPIQYYNRLATGEMIFWLLGVDYPEKWSDLVGVEEERPENTKIIYINDKEPSGTLLEGDKVIMSDDIYESILKVFGVEEKSRVEELFNTIKSINTDPSLSAQKLSIEAYINYALRLSMDETITLGQDEIQNRLYTKLSLIQKPLLLGKSYLPSVLINVNAYSKLYEYTNKVVSTTPESTYRIKDGDSYYDIIELKEHEDNDYIVRLILNSGIASSNTVFTWPNYDDSSLNILCDDVTSFMSSIDINSVNIEAGVIFMTNDKFKTTLADRIVGMTTDVNDISFEYGRIDDRHLELILLDSNDINMETPIEVEID